MKRQAVPLSHYVERHEAGRCASQALGAPSTELVSERAGGVTATRDATPAETSGTSEEQSLKGRVLQDRCSDEKPQ